MISSTINNEKICHHLKDWNTKQIRVCRKNVELMNSVKEGAAMAIRECQHQFRYRKWNCTTMNKKNEPVFGNALNKGREERVKDRCLRSLHKVAYLHVAFYIGSVYMEEGQSSLPRSRFSVKFCVEIVFSFIREEGQPSLAGSRYWLPEISPRRAGNFTYINESSVYTRQRLSWPAFFLDNFSFYKFCLFIGVDYKIKTCTQITDSGFRGNLNKCS